MKEKGLSLLYDCLLHETGKFSKIFFKISWILKIILCHKKPFERG